MNRDTVLKKLSKRSIKSNSIPEATTLVHGVWKTVKEDLPDLKKQLLK